MTLRRFDVVLAFAVVAGLLSLPVTRARADESTIASTPEPSAQEEYTAGRESYGAGLYGRALEQFERSFSREPSPNTRLYIARSLRELGRWSDAAEHYRATVREAEDKGGRYLPTRDAAAIELADVMARIERADGPIAVPAPAPSSADSPPSSPPPPSPLASSTMPPGPSTPASGRPRGATAVTWTAGGVGVAGGVAFAVLYALASNRYTFLEDHCTRARDASCESARSTGKTEETVAYVSLGVGVVAAAVAVVSMTLPSVSSGAASRRRTAWPITF